MIKNGDFGGNNKVFLVKKRLKLSKISDPQLNTQFLPKKHPQNNFLGVFDGILSGNTC